MSTISMPASAPPRRTSRFAGHTDVVPPGDESAWTPSARSPARSKDGLLYGRGAVDMKGGIACSVAAVLDYLAAHGGKPKGLDLVPDHRRRGRHRRQRHRQAAAMGGRARRDIRPLRARRAEQCRGARRLHQDRPPRLAQSARSSSTASRATSPIRTAPTIRCRTLSR